MEKVKERTNKYEVSINLKNNGYYLARISLKLGGGTSKRYEKSGTTEEAALKGLLDLLLENIDTAFKSGLITCKFDDRIAKRLVSSINTIGITTPEIMEKTLLIVNKINYINSCILNNISLQSNIVPFYNNTTAVLNTDPNNVTIKPIQANIVTTTTPLVHNVSSNEQLYTKKEQILIRDLSTEWLKYKFSLCEKSEDNPKPKSKKTMDGYYRKLADIILPYCEKNKKLYLSQMTEDFIKKLLKSVKGQTSKRHVFIVLNMLFDYAIKEKNYEFNPMTKIDKPVQITKTEEEKDDYIEPDEQDQWLDIFEKENTDMSLLFETMLLTGIRPEEACGLKWTALDIETKEIIINNAYKDFIVYDEDMKPIGHTRHDDKLKTPESYRRIPISDELIELLLKHKDKQKEKFKKSQAIRRKGIKWTENEYIFISRTYKPYVSDTLSSALPEMCNKYKLKKITPYGLRHSFATFYAEIGTDESVLMRLMGHSDYQTTQKYYIRISSKRKRLAAEEAHKRIYDRRKAS